MDFSELGGHFPNDCCGSNMNFQSCVDCVCYPHETCDGPLELISDGYCNDETNNAGCNFDGGDCCGACTNTDQCSDCVCHEGGAPALDTSCNYQFSCYLTPNAERKELINI